MKRWTLVAAPAFVAGALVLFASASPAEQASNAPEAKDDLCTILRRDQHAVREASDRHMRELESGEDSDVMDASFSFDTPVAIASFMDSSVSLLHAAVTYPGFIDGTNFNSQFAFSGEESLEESSESWRARMLHTLETISHTYPESPGASVQGSEAIMRVREQVATADLPVVAVQLRGPRSALRQLLRTEQAEGSTKAAGAQGRLYGVRLGQGAWAVAMPDEATLSAIDKACDGGVR